MNSKGARPRALLIAGPSASGKSALALALAERLGGVVINADSMQVYADLPILSAQPDGSDQVRAPHALYGTVDGANAYSVRLWLADVAAVLGTTDALPIVVGGTGLYFKALTAGLSPIPEVPREVRADIRAWAEGRPPAELHAALSRRDPVMAQRLRPTDPQRMIRALEVHAATGTSLADHQRRRETPLLDLALCGAVALVADRTALRQRLDRRFDAMMEAGALAEVARLAERSLDPSLPVMRALGVRPLLDHLRGGQPLGDAAAVAKSETRQYAKRQETFFRHQLAGFVPLAPDAAERALLAAARHS